MLDADEIKEEVDYLVSSIRDPERQGFTLQQLDIIHSDRIMVIQQQELTRVVIYLKPTNPACHLVQQIALSIFMKLQLNMVDFSLIKLQIKLEPDSHNDINGVQKQINDKERVIAALENQEIKKFINSLVDDQD